MTRLIVRRVVESGILRVEEGEERNVGFVGKGTGPVHVEKPRVVRIAFLGRSGPSFSGKWEVKGDFPSCVMLLDERFVSHVALAIATNESPFGWGGERSLHGIGSSHSAGVMLLESEDVLAPLVCVALVVGMGDMLAWTLAMV